MSLFNEIVKLADSPEVRGLARIDERTVNSILRHADDGGFIAISAHRENITNDYERDAEDILAKDSLFRQWASTYKPSELNLDDVPEKLKDDRAVEWLRHRNNEADKMLKKDIEREGYSYSPIYGGYSEKGSNTNSFEPSYIIYNKDRNGKERSIVDLVRFGMELCGKYFQDCFMVQLPGEAPFYLDKDGYKTNKSSTRDVSIDGDDEFFSTSKRKKNNFHKFSNDIEFPDDNDDYVPEKLFEGMYYQKRIELVDRMKRRANGEIFL